MKKNLRIVSAAAAALLAVAPVAATVVPAASTTVQAASSELKSSGDFEELLDPVTVSNPEAAAKDAPKTVKLSEVQDFVNDTLNLDPKNPAVKVDNLSFGAVPSYNKDGNATVTIKFKLKLAQSNVPGVLTDANSSWKNTWGYVGNGTNKQYFTVKKTFKKAPAASNDEAADAYFVPMSTAELLSQGAYANNGTVYAGARISGRVHTIQELRKEIVNHLVQFGHDVVKNGDSSFHPYSSAEWDKYVWNNPSATNTHNLASQLKNQGIDVKDDSATAKFSFGNKPVTIVVRANNGHKISVVFQNTDAVDETTPVVWAWYTQYNQTNHLGNNGTDYEGVYGHHGRYYNRAQQPVMDASGYVRPLIVEQHDDGTFQPTEWFGAWNNNKQHGNISVTPSDSNVDWTKPGLYSITLSATNQDSKTTKVTVPVIVTAKNGNVMTVIKNSNIYTEQNGQMVQANLVNFENTVNPGHQLYVYGPAQTKKLNGQDVQFFRIVSPQANFWVEASALKNGVVSTPAQETTKTVTIMHISTVYDKNGKATTEPALRAYDTYSVVSEPVTINGAKFYKLAGKDQYIKVGNVDGTSRSLKHNSYVYKSSGKRANKKTLKKGSSVTTYGKSFMIAGHQMYRIGKNQYVKKANF